MVIREKRSQANTFRYNFPTFNNEKIHFTITLRHCNDDQWWWHYSALGPPLQVRVTIAGPYMFMFEYKLSLNVPYLDTADFI